MLVAEPSAGKLPPEDGDWLPLCVCVGGGGGAHGHRTRASDRLPAQVLGPQPQSLHSVLQIWG